MNGKDIELLARLRQVMDQQGWTQASLAQTLGVSQGHLSKLLAAKTPLARSMRAKISILIAGVQDGHSPLEARALRALRQSVKFRDLVAAALAIHDNE